MATDKAELNRLLLEAFMLGKCVTMESFNIPPASAASDTSWDLIIAIAEGKKTLAIDTEDLLSILPQDRKEFFRQYLERVKPLKIDSVRELAKRIVNGIS